MGVMDLLKKVATGATDEENRKNKEKMRKLFNECVSGGDAYKLVYCHMENFTNAVIVEVTKHSNFIVGYKKGEVVVIQVDPNLDQHGEAIFFNKANGSVIRASLGYCMASNDKVSCQFVPITYEPGIGRKAKYSVSITQSSSEVAEFRKFFKEGL